MGKNMLRMAPVSSKILITGGFGFVGSKLLQLLRGYDITVLDNLMSGKQLNSSARFIQGDIRNHKLVESLVKEHDIIVHLAGIVGEPSCSMQPIIASQINVQGTYTIANTVKPHQKVIFISSSSVYGNIDARVAHEGINPRPNNHYALDKSLGETSISLCNADWIILRPVSAFGVSSRIRMDLIANNFIYQALTTKKIEVYQPHLYRPIIHVFDFARVIKYAMFDGLAWNERYNVCDPELHLTKLQLAEKIAGYTGAEILSIDGKDLDTRDYAISPEALLESGFIFSTHTIQRAIEEIDINLELIQAHPDMYQTTHMFRQFLSKEERIHV